MSSILPRLSLFAALATVALAGGCGEPAREPVPPGTGGGNEGGGSAGGNPAGGASSTSTSATMGEGGSIEPEDVVSKLEALPGVTVVEELPSDVDGQLFLLEIEQPADHQDPGAPTFKQRIALQHRGFDRPTVLASTGYNLYAIYEMEPTSLVGGNQLLVEHRFFSPSRPEPADWHDLRIWQAATDHHRVVEVFKTLYPSSWLSTGVSKGGMTSVYHRRFYPDDVAGTIAYVAPQSYGDSDPRYLDFLETVGTSDCREALREFQKEVLARRPEMTASMAAADGEEAYSQMGLDGALDFAVIELAFAFWQFQDPGACSSIPGPSASDPEIWGFLSIVSPPWTWSDEPFFQLEPYYFQAAVELGYPGYDDSHLTGLLSVPNGADVAKSLVVPGPTKEMQLDPGAMLDVAGWLANEGERMLFVYGELDPYSAAAFEIGNAKDSFRFFAPGDNHAAVILSLDEPDRTTALQKVQLWADQPPEPPPPAVKAKIAAWREMRRSLGRRLSGPR